MQDIYQQVTDRIIEALERGVVPWRKEWKGGSGTHLPVNHVTGRAYRGANIIVLACSHYASNQWLTYKQAQEIGAQVRKGERSTPIIFWGRDTKTTREGEEKEYSFARGYNVFNVEQCDGIAQALPFDLPLFEPIENAQRIADAFFARPAAPMLRHSGDRAFYSPFADGICMPHPSSFDRAESYYHTLYHEMTHATGAIGRLDRKELAGTAAFGGDCYSKEELVAEFGASFVSAEAGISSEGLMTNAAAYIQGWLRQLKNDKTLAVSAAQKAQRAADYILAREFAPKS